MNEVQAAKQELKDILSSPKFANVSRVVVDTVDIDAERGFTSVKLRRGRKKVIGYAKRHTGEKQMTSLAIRLAVLDGVRRLSGLKR